MILARWQDRWFGATRAREISQGCALVAGDWEDLSALGCMREERSMGKPDDPGFRRWYIWHCHMPTTTSIRFYPEVRYNGAKVHLEAWVRDTTEPILRCCLMGWDAYAIGYTSDEQRADGWSGVATGEGATKNLHVDELEKTEGPPPEGVF